jgi:hypothetical protein
MMQSAARRYHPMSMLRAALPAHVVRSLMMAAERERNALHETARESGFIANLPKATMHIERT